jgi:hypothetical protein
MKRWGETAVAEDDDDMFSQTIAARFAELSNEPLPTDEDADRRAQFAVLDAIMLMHTEIHAHGPVALPAPTARPELQIAAFAPSLTCPGMSPTQPGCVGSPWGAKAASRCVGSPRPLHATSPRWPRAEPPPARPLARTTFDASGFEPVAASPRARAAVSQRPRGVDEAMRSRKLGARGDARGGGSPAATLDQSLRSAKGARPGANADARLNQPFVHPLWTMPLYVSTGSSIPSSPAGSALGAGTRAPFRATAQSEASPWARERIGSFSAWLTDALADGGGEPG